MNKQTILKVNGWFLVIVGFLQAIMTIVGRFTGNGILKILQEQPLGSIGMFEGFMLAGILGVVLIRMSKTPGLIRFLNLTACGIHLTLGIANIVFWSDAFVPMNAEIPGAIATVFHFGFALIEGMIGIKK